LLHTRQLYVELARANEMLRRGAHGA
jgi:hypothetical protein